MALVARHPRKKAGMEGWVGMTRGTGGRNVGEIIINMALFTIQANMRTGQGELSLRVVERSREPGGGGVTCAAVGAKLTIMRIILGMAGITICGQIGEDQIEVTF
jgi:hypothetical protein